MRNFQSLSIWQRSHLLALETYLITKNFPKEELFGLTSQMRRSASSAPTNIADGCGHQSNAQLSKFLHIALGSISELHYQFILCKDLHYISVPLFNKSETETIEIRKMIFAYLNKL
ncbi:MAG: four helix bundle protein [Bacteroidota bacterium]